MFTIKGKFVLDKPLYVICEDCSHEGYVNSYPVRMTMNQFPEFVDEKGCTVEANMIPCEKCGSYGTIAIPTGLDKRWYNVISNLYKSGVDLDMNDDSITVSFETHDCKRLACKLYNDLLSDGCELKYMFGCPTLFDISFEDRFQDNKWIDDMLKFSEIYKNRFDEVKSNLIG